MAKKATKMSKLEKSIYNKAAAINARMKGLESRTFDKIETEYLKHNEFVQMVDTQKLANPDYVTKSGTFKRVFKAKKYTVQQLKAIEQLYSDILINESPLKNLKKEISKITGLNVSAYKQAMTMPGYADSIVNKIKNAALNPNQNYDEYSEDEAKAVGSLYKKYGKDEYKNILVGMGFSKTDLEKSTKGLRK